MKYLGRFLLLLVFSRNLFASDLCDSSCDLSITFPDGGSIEAVEALTITFGDGGFINDGVAITGYSSGDAISLAAGESIVFLANGSFETGRGGNVDYSDIMIISNGVMDLAAAGGNETIFIQSMTLLGTAALNIYNDLEVVDTGSFDVFSGPITVSADLVLTNYGSVSGSFDFELATLTLDTELYDIPGSILIEADTDLTMTSKAVVIETAAPEITATPEEVSASDAPDEAPALKASKDATSSDPIDAATASGGGLINPFSLLTVLLLLISNRIVTRNTIQ